MEKAILKTLIYADIFDYPQKAYEIHKWLIGRQVTLRQVEKGIQRLIEKQKVESQKEYIFLRGRKELVRKRKIRQNQSNKFLLKAKLATYVLKAIPWIKLAGVSGGLAMKNASKDDDIDLFIVTSKNRLWLSRILTIALLDLLGVRRKAGIKPNKVAGKLCLNILLEEDRLAQSKSDIYLAHEVLQMQVLWQRGGIYQKYLEENEWAFNLLPNWMGNQHQVSRTHNTNYLINNTLDRLEELAKKFQLWYMKKPEGMERVEDGALYFHPNDTRSQVLADFRQRFKKLSTS